MGAARDGQRSLLSTSWSSTQIQTLLGCTGLFGAPGEMLGKGVERGSVLSQHLPHSLSRAEGQWGTLEQEEEEVDPMNNFPCCSWESQEGSKAEVLGGESMYYMLRWEIQDHVGVA